jgi:superfamily II RNA helicase
MAFQFGQSGPLLDLLPSRDEATSDLILDRFLSYIKNKGLDLYSAQEEAILELLEGNNVILNTPTGSGKSLVALALQFNSLAYGRRSFYTSPIKALVNEKFFSLCRDFGPDQVGMITGDATVNASASIICCTAEILMNDALREGDQARIDDVIMDEFHYYSDRERGVAWQVPLLTLPQSRFLLMSATLGDTTPFEKALTDLNGKKTTVVKSVERPVPLDYQYSETALHEKVVQLIAAGRAPIYLVNFTQRECAEEAQNFMSIDICTKDEKRAISEILEGFHFSSPYGKELKKFLKHGMGIHHASLLPKYRGLVEKLAQKGLLKIIFGTDTLGVGVNVPIRTVLLTKLCKFDGDKTVILSVRDFKQISGRAGRKGFDDLGTVVVQAPAHVIDNLRNEQKSAGDPKKLKKLVKQKPPEKGFLPWNQETFQKLVNGQPEALISRFKVNHAMLLNVLSRPVRENPLGVETDGCDAMRSIIRHCHESENSIRRIRKNAFQLFRSLVDRKIIELNPLRVNVDLQEDFSLNHALSLYLVDTLKLLDPAQPNYALDVLTLVESILEDPDLILRKQLDRIKTEKMAEMKQEGVEFDQRIEELDKLEYPKPNREFIYGTFNDFAAAHPWLGQENISPKSIAREMIENFHSFAEYIREYDLHRTEGLLLRYLSDVYKALVQNVPDSAKNEELFEISIYFGTMIREIDSSLLDDWERMRNPEAFTGESADTAAQKQAEETKKAFSLKTFKIMVRNEVFRLVKTLATGDFEEAVSLLQPEATPPTPPAIAVTLDFLRATSKAYAESGHSRICIDQKARGPNYFSMTGEPDGKTWRVQQTLTDPEEHNDWSIDLIATPTDGKPSLRLVRIGAIGQE